MNNHIGVRVVGIGVFVQLPEGADTDSNEFSLTPTLLALQAAFRAIGMEVQFIKWPTSDQIPEVVIGSKDSN